MQLTRYVNKENIKTAHTTQYQIKENNSVKKKNERKTKTDISS